ncbi:hypothetical protein B9Z65_1780 [Elsinoe australis]|uniref:Uncharacterized protein n=1 Tax=Elsinoe australis TaxID=40998 RepID=A0A2P7YKU8_9PEZI|nr:hypothetical protein B9Z65_1780 [Elsinoe australis]
MKVTLSSALCLALSLSMASAQFQVLPSSHISRRADTAAYDAKKLELQDQLKQAAANPSEASKIQQELLELNKMQQDDINGGQTANGGTVAKRSPQSAADIKAQEDAKKAVNDMTVQQNKVIEDHAASDAQKQQEDADIQAQRKADNPGSGVGAGVLTQHITPSQVRGWDGQLVSQGPDENGPTM